MPCQRLKGVKIIGAKTPYPPQSKQWNWQVGNLILQINSQISTAVSCYNFASETDDWFHPSHFWIKVAPMLIILNMHDNKTWRFETCPHFWINPHSSKTDFISPIPSNSEQNWCGWVILPFLIQLPCSLVRNLLFYTWNFPDVVVTIK